MSFGEVLWTFFLVFIWFAWIWMVVSILIDIFRSDDLSGWGKAGWTVLVVFFTWLGVLIYLIARGGGMAQRRVDDAARMQKAQEQYIRQVAGAGGPSAADQLHKLSELKDKGVLSEAEFQAEKAKILA